ncbi:MAG: hypothetical protein GX786_11110 [Clostridiales bacterium]|nr:hypothetical protein [Clostridiales bacterium]
MKKVVIWFCLLLICLSPYFAVWGEKEEYRVWYDEHYESYFEKPEPLIFPGEEETVPLYKEKDDKKAVGTLPIGSIVKVLSSQQDDGRRLCTLEEGETFYVEEEHLLFLSQEREFLSWVREKKTVDEKLFYTEKDKTLQEEGVEGQEAINSVFLSAFPLFAAPREIAAILRTVPKDASVKITERIGPWYQVEHEGIQGYTLCQNLYPLAEEEYLLADYLKPYEQLTWVGIILPAEGRVQIPVYQYPDIKADPVCTVLAGDDVLLDFIAEEWVKIKQGYIPKEQVQILRYFY